MKFRLLILKARLMRFMLRKVIALEDKANESVKREWKKHNDKIPGWKCHCGDCLDVYIERAFY